MPTLLHIDSSPLYGRSVSRELTAAFVAEWHTVHPDGAIIDRDLTATSIPPITAEWVGAIYTPEDGRTPQQKELLSLSDSLLAELEQSDEYVIGVPMHNFGVPSALKLWIDQICRVGRTFVYADGKPKGLLLGKKATFLIATCGIYDPQTQMASFQFCGALSTVRLWISRREGCDFHHRRWNQGAQPRSRPAGVSRSISSGRADARAKPRRSCPVKIASITARYLLGLLFTVFGLNGFFHFIHQAPPTNPLALQFFGAVIASHFAAFFFAIQVLGGLFLLSGFFVPLALTLLAAVLYNILAFHLTLDSGAGIGPGLVACVLWVLVFLQYRGSFHGIFTVKPATQS